MSCRFSRQTAADSCYSFKHQKAMADRVQFHAFSDTNALLALLVRLANTVPQDDGPIA